MMTPADRRFDRKLRRKARLEYIVAQTKILFFYSDTTAVRAFASLGALGWAAGMLLPLHAFERHGFEWMAAVASQRVWGLLFLLYGLAAFSRLYDPELGQPRRTRRQRVKFALGLAVNVLGFSLWFSVASLFTLAIGEFAPSMSLEWVLCGALFVTLIRSGQGPYKTRL